MRNSRFNEARIVGGVREREAGVSTVEVCREHGISVAAIDKQRARCDGLETSEAKARVRWHFTLAAAAYNLIRRPKLLAAP